MTHLTIEELLGLRDGDGADAHRAHLAACQECRGALTRLDELRARLAELPVSAPEHDCWPAVRAAAETIRWRAPWVWTGRVVASLAAVFTLVVGIRGSLEAWRESQVARETNAVMAESQRLERYLREYDTTGRVIGGETAATLADLEEQVAAVDAQLMQANPGRATSRDVLDLWQERVRLLDAMANVQTTRVAYVGL